MSKNVIQVLTPDVVAKIAAGEVIEKPASVVKELIENSIDAKSTQITLKIEDAGLRLIEVSDNGVGMGQKDAELAFTAHSTSKISNIEDLGKLITLGFRGEALASIAAVADIEMDTTKDGESTNVKISNQKIQISNSSIDKGTVLKVKMLFNRVPARKKFLRSEATEYKHIQDIFVRHAIVNPNIHFKLFNNGKLVYNLPATDQLQTRIFDIWGAKVAKHINEVYYDAPGLKISGLIGHPEVARRDKSMQYIFLNNRPILSTLIAKSVEDAFHGTKSEMFYPIYFLMLSINPEEVDVNVHPRKMEVKFSNTNMIFSAVKRAVNQQLSNILQNGVKQHFDVKKPENKPLVGLNIPPHQGSEKKQQLNSYGHENKSFSFREREANYSKFQNNSGQKMSIMDQSLAFNKLIGATNSFTDADTTGTNKGQSFTTIDDSFNAKQFFNTFIIVQRTDKILFIDQHAADERVKYEKLLKQIDMKVPGAVSIQRLLVPQTIELDQAKFDLLIENLEIFNSLGLDIEQFGKTTLKLNAIPSLLEKFDFQKFIEEILEREVIELDQKELLHEILATMACHGSIRAGRKMHDQEVTKLVQDLFKCEKPYSCPHGRPIIWEMSKYEIEKKFKRTGFC